MSQRALLLATRDHLRTKLGLKPEACEITFQGMPLPMSGETFFGVWEGDWNCQSTESLEETYGVSVTISVRLPAVPQDRQGPEILAKAGWGLMELAEQVRAAIHSNYELMDAANALIKSSTTNGFVEPLRFKNGGRNERKAGDWYAARGEKQAGMARTLTFGDAKRIQVIDHTAEGMT